jgi:hypothetical protein
MRAIFMTGVLAALALAAPLGTAGETPGAVVGKDAHPLSIDRLAFAPDGKLVIADNQGAALYAVDLPRAADAQGVKPVAAIGAQVAALMGTDADGVTFTDMTVDPRSGQAYLGAVRRSGESGLFRVNGLGEVKAVSLAGLSYVTVALPNVRPLNPAYRSVRQDTVTSMAFDGGRLYVAGLSNEEFSSRLRSLPYPFRTAGAGSGVEVYHTSHGQLETRSPIYTLLPMTFGDSRELLAAYICTPLVRLKEDDLVDGAEVRGANIAEMGRHNRPIAMLRYSKDGQDRLIMSNSRRGLLSLPVSAIQSAPVIPYEPTTIDTRDLGARRVRDMTGVDQIALAGGDRFAALVREGVGQVDLKVAALP